VGGGLRALSAGETTAEGVDGVKFLGAVPYAKFDAKIKELLAPDEARQISREVH
jgi:hypothetical protein